MPRIAETAAARKRARDEVAEQPTNGDGQKRRAAEWVRAYADGSANKFSSVRASPDLLGCGLKFKADYGRQAEAERRTLHEVTDWLFSRNGHDAGQVEITYVGSTTPDVKYRRDLVTGALVDRAVQDAARGACRAEYHDCGEPGVTSPMIIGGLQRQIQSIVDQLSPHNVHNYMTLPDGARVGTVRRLSRPSIHPFELERAS